MPVGREVDEVARGEEASTVEDVHFPRLDFLASAGGYYFLSGVQTFGVEFVTKQYGIAQALSTLVLLVIGAAGVLGVLTGGVAAGAAPTAVGAAAVAGPSGAGAGFVTLVGTRPDSLAMSPPSATVTWPVKRMYAPSNPAIWARTR